MMKHDFTAFQATGFNNGGANELGDIEHGSIAKILPFPTQNHRPIRQEWQRKSLFGLHLVDAKLDYVVDRLAVLARLRTQHIVHFVNAHCVNMAAKDGEYLGHLQSASALLPDGSGIKLAAKLAGVKLGDNLNGTDLFPLLCERAARDGLSLYLHGARPGIAQAAADAMTARFPNLRIAGTSSGYMDDRDIPALLNEINASGADIVLVAMGVPAQEKWVAKHAPLLNARLIMGVGGLFDYYSGRIPRAPEAMRRIGMEWVWRFMQEPRRLFTRYTFGNAEFLARALFRRAVADNVRVQSFFMLKRASDCLWGLLSLLMLMPLMLAVAVMIKMEDGGPVFFRQVRVGRYGKPFHMWKFRSMRVDAEQILEQIRAQSDREGAGFKMKNDPRVSKIGAFIRRYSIDELPQIFNVIMGDMSLVGPRPSLPIEMVSAPRHALDRLKGRPGITCSWQVSGRAQIPYDRQCAMDVEYLENPAFLTDLSLMLRTVPAVLKADGAY
jgi:exopolysaccharide biosynthesis WecB/TagA/CpsF family protein